MWQGEAGGRDAGQETVAGVELVVVSGGACDEEHASRVCVCVPAAFWACAEEVWVGETWLGTHHIWLG